MANERTNPGLHDAHGRASAEDSPNLSHCPCCGPVATPTRRACAESGCGYCAIAEAQLKTKPPLTHVAIRYGMRVWSLPAPYRHHHIFSVMRYLGEEVKGDGEQGFLDDSGRFIRRSAAKLVAQVNGQLKNGKTIAHILTSEDLW